MFFKHYLYYYVFILALSMKGYDGASKDRSSEEAGGDESDEKDGERGNHLILILVDGFRWDYPNECEMHGFSEIKNTGSRAMYMQPVFPSNSYPNYYSLATGLYPENHGIVGNIMYDPEHNSLFRMLPDYNSTLLYWWDGAEPIWITATKQNKSVSMYRWPGCQVKFGNTKVFKCLGYQETSGIDEFKKDLESAMDDIQHHNVDMSMVYVEHVDRVTHQHGPDSEQGKRAIREVDRVLRDFLEELHLRHLDDDINVIVVSDHGMADTDTKNVTEIELPKILHDELDNIKYILDSRAFCGIVPKTGVPVNQIYNALMKDKKGYDVYKKEDIPEKYHLKNHIRTPAIILIAEQGYYMEGVEERISQVPFENYDQDWDNDEDGIDDDDPTLSEGTHGYDPFSVHSMWGIFYATGPVFKRGYEGQPINIVDVYNVMTRIIEIKGLKNDGEWSDVDDYFKPPEDRSSSDLTRCSLFLTLCCFFVLTIV